MTKHYQLTAIEDVFEDGSTGEYPQTHPPRANTKSYNLLDRPPRITDKDEWEELEKVSEVRGSLSDAVIRTEEVGEYPPTVWEVLYGFDEDLAENSYESRVLDNGPSTDDWNHFICFWAAVSRATEPFRVVSSAERLGWTTVDDIRHNDANPVMIHAYCVDNTIDLYEYNVVEDAEYSTEPSHTLELSVSKIVV